MFSSNISQACFVPQLLINRIAIVIWIQWTDLLLAYVYNSDKSFGSCLEPMACNSCMQTGHIYHKSWFCQRKVEVLQLFKQTSYWVGNCSYKMAHFLTSSFGYWILCIVIEVTETLPLTCLWNWTVGIEHDMTWFF